MKKIFLAGILFSYLAYAYVSNSVWRVGASGGLPDYGQVNLGASTAIVNILPITNGGTGAATQSNALNALAGVQTSGYYLRGNGTNVVMSGIQAADVPTLNQSTTGTASNVTGTVAIANGGTGQIAQQSALNALAGGSTSGYYLRGNGTNVVLSGIQAGDVPTLNQSTTGTASNVTGTVAIVNGGTGQITQQAALNALAGSSTSGYYLRGNGTNVVMSGIQAADVPTLNQSTTGTASNVTGTVAIANGGTGQITANNALNALLPTQTGNANKYLLTNGASTSWATAAGGIAPTVQKFTSGIGTYTTPTNPSPLYIRVRMVGGGGGGAGSGTTAGTTPTAGGNTTFGTTLLVANGGAVTSGLGHVGGAGGTASLGTGPVGIAVTGSSGGPSLYVDQGGTYATMVAGGAGGSSALGGGGAGGTNSDAAVAGVTNTGSGGGGGSIYGINAEFSGAGGGSGGYVDAVITSPLSSYSYLVGIAGTGGGVGGSGKAGAPGGSGLIIVEEHYQ